MEPARRRGRPAVDVDPHRGLARGRPERGRRGDPRDPGPGQRQAARQGHRRRPTPRPPTSRRPSSPASGSRRSWTAGRRTGSSWPAAASWSTSSSGEHRGPADALAFDRYLAETTARGRGRRPCAPGDRPRRVSRRRRDVRPGRRPAGDRAWPVDARLPLRDHPAHVARQPAAGRRRRPAEPGRPHRGHRASGSATSRSARSRTPRSLARAVIAAQLAHRGARRRSDPARRSPQAAPERRLRGR